MSVPTILSSVGRMAYEPKKLKTITTDMKLLIIEECYRILEVTALVEKYVLPQSTVSTEGKLRRESASEPASSQCKCI